MVAGGHHRHLRHYEDGFERLQRRSSKIAGGLWDLHLLPAKAIHDVRWRAYPLMYYFEWRSSLAVSSRI
jgi:hypothetical protein